MKEKLSETGMTRDFFSEQTQSCLTSSFGDVELWNFQSVFADIRSNTFTATVCSLNTPVWKLREEQREGRERGRDRERQTDLESASAKEAQKVS